MSVDLTCPNCGARCTQANHLNRFKRRHPGMCSRRAQEQAAKRSFNEQLAEGVKSVETETNLFIEEGIVKSK
jgi:hypothetical protein